MYIMLSYLISIKRYQVCKFSNCLVLIVFYALQLTLTPRLVHADNLPSNRFEDPFVSITSGMAACLVPMGPAVTAEEFALEAHWRSQRGVSCHMAGRCRLANAYLYDKEIIPRVQLAIASSGRFKHTSIWAYGQRRWVYLQGCVTSQDEAVELERIVRLIDDVESVINELSVGTQARPRYRQAKDKHTP
jgi:BON domain